MSAKREIGAWEVGRHFGKIDLDRIGYFDDPSPAPFDKYQGVPIKLRDSTDKGRQLYPGPPEEFFEKKFVRLSDGEALAGPWKKKLKEQLRRERAKFARMLPPSPSKKHSTPGDWYGCFEKLTYFSPQLRVERTKKKTEREPPNFKIKPNPRGGPGYANITLNPFPSYSHEPYERVIKKGDGRPMTGRFLNASAPINYFTPNPYGEEKPGPTYIRLREVAPKLIGSGKFYIPFPKNPGGNHAGCFSKFPEYQSNPYDITIGKRAKFLQRMVSGGPPLRSKYTNSIIEHVTKISCNVQNYRKYQEQVYPLRK